MSDQDELHIVTQKAFDNWLAHTDTRITMLLAYLPSSVAEQLDFSVESLQVLEHWLLSEYENHEPLLVGDGLRIREWLMTYVGQVYQQHVRGAHWEVEMKDTRMVDYGIPRVRSIVGFHRVWSSITITLFRRKGNMLASSLIHNIKRATERQAEQRQNEAADTIPPLPAPISYHSHLYTFTLVDAADQAMLHSALAKTSKGNVTRVSDNRLDISLDEWRLSVILHSATEDEDIQNAFEFAAMKAGLAQDKTACAASYEIVGGDDDEMRYFNDYVAVIEVLERVFPNSFHTASN